MLLSTPLSVRFPPTPAEPTTRPPPHPQASEGQAYSVPLAPGASASAAEGHHVVVSFELSPALSPQQASVRFFNQAAGVNAVFPARQSGGKFAAAVSLADKVAAFDHASGDYEVWGCGLASFRL
jgi:hypothetical protein